MDSGIRLVEGDCLGLDDESAAAGHGIPRVNGHVHHDLLNLAGICRDAWLTGIGKGHKLDVFADETSQHPPTLEYDQVETEDPRLADLMP